MPRFAADLSVMYAGQALVDRFGAAAADGFDAVRCPPPYDWPAAQLAECLSAHRLTLVAFEAPPGDWAAGERGLACLPGRRDEFRRSFVERALPYTQALGCRQLHVMAGRTPAGAPPAALRALYLANLAWAAELAASEGLVLLIEPVPAARLPGYFLRRLAEARAVIDELAVPNLRLQLSLPAGLRDRPAALAPLRRALQGGLLAHLRLDGSADDAATLLAQLDAPGWPGPVSGTRSPSGPTT